MDERVDVTHLRVHSWYSLLRATPSVEALVARAQANGMKYLALTDLNVLYGAVTFAHTCREGAIRPLLGMTVTVTPPPGETMLETAVSGQLVLLATNPTGYRSLCRISSHLQSKPSSAQSTPLLSWEMLKQYRDGLICLTGGRQGWLERYLRAGDRLAAGRIVSRLGGIFEENCYLSLELHTPEDTAVAHEIEALGTRFGLATVAVRPVYCLTTEDVPLLRLLAAIDLNCPVEMVPDYMLPSGGETAVSPHWLSPAEMHTLYAEFPDALARTSEIAQQCEYVLPDGRPIWPLFSLPNTQSPEEALAQQAKTGLETRYGPDIPATVWQRWEHELQEIGRFGFSPLFLLVADIVQYARQNGIPVSTRGSVANSLIAYCLGITTVDPVAHDLLFERFLNPARSSLPDIDLDFCSRRRDEVLAYVRQKYGEDRVALVATISTMRPRSAVRETAKAHGMTEAEIKQLTAVLPRGWHPDPQRRDLRTVEEVISEIPDPKSQTIMRLAARLVGQPHHLSVHPGGVIVTPGPLTDVVPVQYTPKGFLITQYDHADVEAVGLPKVDLLGIRALTVLADTAELVRRFHQPDFRLTDIPLADEKTAVLLANGNTIGVFQCESAGAQRTLRQLRAQNIRDLAVANAFFKPGPATGGMARAFIRRYRGEEPVTFLHPALEPILRRTQGVLLFQEQILRVAREIAGLSWAEADRLRKGMSKFQRSEMTALAERFIAGCQRPAPEGPGLTAQQAEQLWQQVVAFAGYGFNQGHATAYADVSYRSAYLKAHWPAEFLCARLADAGGFHHPAVYLAEARRLGIGVRPPHVNVSGRRCTLSYEPEPVLWLGLGEVRDVRRQTVAAIVAERGKRPFASLRDLTARVSLQEKELLHLIRAGALDGLGESRVAMLAEATEVMRAGSAFQMAFGFAVETAVSAETAAQRLAWEKMLLGLPVSVNPLELSVSPLPERVSLRQLSQTNGRTVQIVAFRLPGWTGLGGVFISDGDEYVIADGNLPGREFPFWQPFVARGRWRVDEWGSGLFEVQVMRWLA